MSQRVRNYLGLGLAAALMLEPFSAGATENDESHASFGFNDTLIGLPPAPGLYLRDDVTVQLSNRVNDQDGNKLSIRLGGNNLALKFRENVAADVVSFAYVPDYKIPYINATVGIAAFDELASAHVGFTSGLGIPERRSQTNGGFGDLNIVPLFLGFDLPRTDFHAILAPFTFTAPVGRYSRSLSSNIGLNYYTWRPSLGITYINKTGQEASFNLGGFVNSQNQATGYKSGSEFYAGYAFQQYLSPRFAFGIGGYYYRQISDDKLHGKTVNAISAADILNGGPGNRGETFAIGPIISYNPTNSIVFEAHWDHEVLAYNRDQREIIYARGTIKF